MKSFSKVIYMVAIILVTALIVVVCKGIINGEKNPLVTMQIAYYDQEGNEQVGDVKIELDQTNAPITTANFVNLVQNGFYNNLKFHRIIKDFMIQGGDPEGTGAGSAKLSDLDKKVQKDSNSDHAYSIKGEFVANSVNNALKFERGVVGLARSDYSQQGFTEEGYNSGSSQFFIVTTNKQSTLQSLNGSYASFGRVKEGMEVVDKVMELYATDEESTDKVKLSYTSENNEQTGKQNVTITSNLEIDGAKVPAGWQLEQDAKTLKKELDKDVEEKVVLTSKTGIVGAMNVKAGDKGDNSPKMKNVTVDTFGAKYDVPKTTNFDEVLQKVNYAMQQQQTKAQTTTAE